MNNPFVIIFVGFPGIGKTTVGNLLTKVVSNENTKFRYIDQDMCNSNPKEYISQIDDHLKNGYNLVLGKNHHNEKMLKDVYDVLNKNGITSIIFNFVPDLDANSITDILVERIRNRKGHQNLGIKSEENPTGMEEEEVRKIVNGFYKSYEKPKHCIQLDFMQSPDQIAYYIYDYLRVKTFVGGEFTLEDFTKVNWKELKPNELPKKKLYYAFSISKDDHDKIIDTIKEVTSSKGIDISSYKFQDKFHITSVFLANGITNSTIATLNKWCEENVNKEFKINLKYIALSKKLICMPVDILDGMSQNLHPHITIALTQSAKPYESNKVIESGEYEAIDYTSELTITTKLDVY